MSSGYLSAQRPLQRIEKEVPEMRHMICTKFNRCLFCGYKDESGDPFNTV